MVAVPVTFAVVAAVGFVTLPASADNPRSALVASAGDAFSNAVETFRTVWGRLFAAEETPTLVTSPQATQPPRPSIPVSAVASTTPVHNELIATRPNVPIQPIQQVQGKQTIVNQPVIERIVERVVQGAPASLAGYVTQAEFASQINILKDDFGKTMYGTTYPAPSSSYASGGIMNVVAQSQRIDNLANTTITNPTITGGSITAASIIGSISNAIDTASAAIASLTGTELTYTRAIFESATTTTLYVSATSTTQGLKISSLDCSSLGNGGTLTTDASGNVVCAADDGGSGSVAGSDTQVQFNNSGSLGASSNFTFSNSGNKLTITNASTTNLTAGYASTSNLVASNSFTLGSLTGFLKATAGAVSTALINLASDVTGILPILNGGTGTSTAPTYGKVLVGNALGGYDLTATSSLGITGGGGGTWGSITGTLGSQSDLQAALDAKLSLSNWYATTTNGLAEGGTNLYFTTNRVASVIAGTTTDALAQGTTNKYWSNTLFDNRLSATTSVSGITTLPSLSLPSGQVSGLGSLAALSSINNSNWSGTALAVGNGGTGATSFSYGLVLGNGTNALTQIATSSLGLTVSSFASPNISQWTNNAGYLTSLTGAASSTLLADNNTFSGTNIFSSTITGSISGNAGTVTNGVYTTGAGTVFLAPGGSAAALTSFPTFNQNTTGSAATLTTARTINGTSFNGSADITITAASSTLLSNNNTFSGVNSFTGNTTLGNATTTNLFSTTASSTNLFAQSAAFGSISFTNTLGVANGGTGAASLTGLVKGNGTSAFTAAAAGTDFVAPATTISAGAGLSGGGDLSTNRTLSLNLANGNSWTGLQTFANASSTLASVFQTLYIGGTATTTIQGNTTGTSTIQGFLNVAGTNSTSTFSGALASTYLNLTGTAATSTAANGFNLTAGCFSILGTCVGGESSQWTTSGSNIYYTAGSVFIGTTTPGRIFTVFNTSANPQQRISYDATRYAELYADASGALNLTTTGKILNFLDGNLYLCDGGACPTTPVQGYPAFTSQGNLVAGGTVYAGAFGPATCPSGMIPVPASPADGQQGFCVDKYEAQSSAGNEVSVSGGSPWVSITQTSARAECIRAGKHLITEKEWMTIAHNAENVGWNWQGGVAGTNQMSDGHSDNAPASALATAADASACSGTGQTCDLSTWSSQRRVYKLSNNQYIWDLGGNVWEWVDQTVTNDYPIVNSAAAGWQVCSTAGDGICGNTRTTNDQWYRGGFSTIAGFLRGGSWSYGANDGAFTLSLSSAPSDSFTNFGFRCSR